MLSNIGATTLGVLAVALGIFGVANSWPWWGIAIAVAVCIFGAILALLPGRKSSNGKEDSTFIKGDRNELNFRNVYTDADLFLDGKGNKAKFRNVIHRSKNH